MTSPDLAHIARQHTLGGDPIPDVVLEFADGRPVDLVWRNDVDGLTFRIDDRFVNDESWLFCRADGVPLHPERFSREFLRKQEAYNKANPDDPLPRLKLHGLRHTWVTLALEEGIDIHVVSDRLDHSSTHVTSQICSHVRRPLQSDVADRVAARIFARGRGQSADGG